LHLKRKKKNPNPKKPFKKNPWKPWKPGTPFNPIPQKRKAYPIFCIDNKGTILVKKKRKNLRRYFDVREAIKQFVIHTEYFHEIFGILFVLY
jgi:hypothetical protein